MIFHKTLISFFLIITFLNLELKSQDFGTGCKLDAEVYQKIPLSANLSRGDYANLPKKYSLKKYAPVPQNQGSFGTCVGWSTAYASRTIMMAKQQGWTNLVLISQEALSPFFVYEQAKSVTDIYCQEGTSLFNALEIMKQVGTVKIADFASQCGQVITSNLEKEAGNYKIKDYKRLFESGATNKVQIIKKSISEDKPVVIGIQCCTESFLKAKNVDSWELGENENADLEGGHALTVIGYDDAKNGGSFELMNSWGTTWGNQGFIWMTYKDFSKFCFEAYEMIIDTKEKNTLSGTVRFALSAEKNMETYYRGGYYEMKENYPSGTGFRMYINNNEPAYVYAFVYDLSKNTYKVFPHSEKVSAYLGYKGNNIAIPSEDYDMYLDDKEGTDYFCVLYSLEKLDFDSVLKSIRRGKGSFMNRLDYAVGDKLIDKKNINYYSRNQIGFKGSTMDKEVKSIIPIVVKITHTKVED